MGPLPSRPALRGIALLDQPESNFRVRDDGGELRERSATINAGTRDQESGAGAANCRLTILDCRLAIGDFPVSSFQFRFSSFALWFFR